MSCSWNPGDERAQKIAKAMGSQTASDILQILGEEPRSLTDITERLNIPMNTAIVPHREPAGCRPHRGSTDKVQHQGQGGQDLHADQPAAGGCTPPVQCPHTFAEIRIPVRDRSGLFGDDLGPFPVVRAGKSDPWQREQHEFSTAGCLQGRWLCRCQSGYRDGCPECHHNARGVMTGTKSVADTWVANVTPALVSTPSPTLMLPHLPFRRVPWTAAPVPYSRLLTRRSHSSLEACS